MQYSSLGHVQGVPRPRSMTAAVGSRSSPQLCLREEAGIETKDGCMDDTDIRSAMHLGQHHLKGARRDIQSSTPCMWWAM